MGTDGGVRNVLGRDGGVERLLKLVEDEDEGCILRGLVAMGNLATSCEGREKVLAFRGKERIKSVVEAAKANGKEDVRETGEAVLEVLG